MGIVDPQATALNSYVGGAFQQATSGVTRTSQLYIYRARCTIFILSKTKIATSLKWRVSLSMGLNTGRVCEV